MKRNEAITYVRRLLRCLKGIVIVLNSSCSILHALLNVNQRTWYVALDYCSRLQSLIVGQMSPKNLAVVFAPTIMRDTSLEREMTDMHAKNLAIQFVIENSNTIFEDA